MNSLMSLIVMVIGGAFFGFGLAESGMVSSRVVLQFLTLKDFGLLLVMGSAIAVTIIFYQFSPRLLNKPFLGGTFDKRVLDLDSKVVIGSALFGIGWGISGICPGPAIAALGIGNVEVIWTLAGIFIGAYLHAYWASLNSR